MAMTELSDAKAYLREHFDEGVDCPCCGQLVRRWKIALNANMARFLISLVREYERTGTWVHYQQCNFVGRDYPHLEKWGLMESATNTDEAKRTSGLWRPTPRGMAFAYNQTTVASHAYIYNKKLLDFSADLISVIQALGKHFDYQELLNPQKGDEHEAE